MNQRIYCECGGVSMLYGRCIGCKRVRPSSEEIRSAIKNNKEEHDTLMDELAKALRLEKEDLKREK